MNGKMAAGATFGRFGEMDKRKQRRAPAKRKLSPVQIETDVEAEPEPEPETNDRERESRQESRQEPRQEPESVVSHEQMAVPLQIGADAVIVYDQPPASNFFGSSLLVDSSGRLIVADAVYDVKSQDGDARRVQHQQQHQQQQPHQLVQGDYEIVQFVPAADVNADQDAQDQDNVNDAEACWLNTKYEFIVRKLQLEYGAGVKLLHTRNGVIKCIYFTTPAMQQAFNSIPQFLCIETDLNFKSAVIGQSDLVRQNVCLMLAEDGNGRSIIVSAGISTIGDNTRWLIETFKSCNPAWRQVRCILVEPGSNSEAIKRSFLGAHVCCNAWQAARFTSKYSLSPTPVQSIYSYINLFLKGQVSDNSQIRFLIGGHALNRLSRILDKDNLTNLLHNGLEKVINKFEPLETTQSLQPEEFLTFFFDIIRSMEEDRKNYALTRLQETINSKQSPTDTLTHYAYFLIQQQTLLAQQKIDQLNSTESKEFTDYGTSTQQCLCLFGRIFRLPCRHILMLTSELKVKSHIPFELRWTVYHCLFGCEIDTRPVSPNEAIGNGSEQTDQQPQVIFCAPTSGTFTTNTDGVQYIKAEPTTQPA